MEDEVQNSDATPSTVVGRRPRTNPKARVFLLIAICAFIVFAVIGRRYSLLIMYLVLGIAQFTVHLRPPTVVSATGIQRPWRTRSFIGWGQVASVSPPVPGKFAPRLNLVGGRSVALDDVPAEESALVAEIGGKELLLPAPYKPPPPSLPSERPRSDQEIEADVERRARALAEERRRLAGG